MKDAVLPDANAGPAGMRLDQVAIAIRSKNAGPCLLTLDVIFTSPEAFRKAGNQLPRLAAHVSQHYRVAQDAVRLFVFEPALAIKITIPRDVMSGAPGDRDVYGAQQHAPMLDVDIPL